LHKHKHNKVIVGHSECLHDLVALASLVTVP
jgi:hypothetical protein